jgi:hypothetical protein
VSDRVRRSTSSPSDAWRLNELVRRRRLREQARRPLAVNLAEGLALSEFLATFRGSARR